MAFIPCLSRKSPFQGSPASPREAPKGPQQWPGSSYRHPGITGGHPKIYFSSYLTRKSNTLRSNISSRPWGITRPALETHFPSCLSRKSLPGSARDGHFPLPVKEKGSFLAHPRLSYRPVRALGGPKPEKLQTLMVSSCFQRGFGAPPHLPNLRYYKPFHRAYC